MPLLGSARILGEPSLSQNPLAGTVELHGSLGLPGGDREFSRRIKGDRSRPHGTDRL